MNANYTGSQAADMHRKLASIAGQFPPPLAPEIAAFLNGPCACADSALLRTTLDLFNARFGKPVPASAPDYDQQVWHKLNDVAGSVQNEVWQFELDGIRNGPPPAS